MKNDHLPCDLHRVPYRLSHISQPCTKCIGKYKCELSTDPPNKVEVEKDGTRTELAFNKETVPYSVQPCVLELL